MNDLKNSNRVLPETRLAALVVVLILGLASALLYIWPDNTEELFAWTIRPRMTPLLMGAGYLGGAYSLARAVMPTRWQQVGNLFPAIVPFTVCMAVATVLHWDRFNHNHVTFWLWVAVYATTPILITVLWLRNRRADPGTPDPDDVLMPQAVRWLLMASSVSAGGIALFMFFLPDAAISIWPWQITPLTSRVIGGWFALTASTSLMLFRDPRWSASRFAIQGAIIFAGFTLLGILRAWGDFNPDNPLTWGYTALIAGSFAGFIALYLLMEMRRRDQPAQNSP